MTRRAKPLLAACVLAVLLVPGASPSQAKQDPVTPAGAVHRHHPPTTHDPSITFTNPLGRSRGPGTGGGLL
jgi:hypothetical protein